MQVARQEWWEMFGWFKKKPDPLLTKGVTAPMLDDELFEIVGESHRQDAIARVVGRKTEAAVRQPVQITFVPENSNPHDKFAVAVFITLEGAGSDPVQVGYIARAEARQYRKKFGDASRRAHGVVVKPEGFDVNFGVFMN